MGAGAGGTVGAGSLAVAAPLPRLVARLGKGKGGGGGREIVWFCNLFLRTRPHGGDMGRSVAAAAAIDRTVGSCSPRFPPTPVRGACLVDHTHAPAPQMRH